MTEENYEQKLSELSSKVEAKCDEYLKIKASFISELDALDKEVNELLEKGDALGYEVLFMDNRLEELRGVNE